MKRHLWIVLVVLGTLMASAQAAVAQRGGQPSQGGGRGAPPRGGGQPAHPSHGGGSPSRGGGYYHHGGGHGSHGGVEVYYGPGFWWPYPYYYPYYPSYPYYPPRVIEERSVDIYVEPVPQPEKTNYWYYCRDPRGYYPHVNTCPSGWIKIAPPPVEPSGGEE